MFSRGMSEVRHELLRLRQDRVVAAAGAPADFLVGDEVLACQRYSFCCFRRHPTVTLLRTNSLIFSSICAILNGRPVTLFRPSASTRKRARMSICSWPRFISGISTRSNRERTSPRLRGKGFRWRRCAARDRKTPRLRPLDGRESRAVRAAPAEHEQCAFLLADDLQVRDVVGDALDLLGAEAHHAVVVLGVVAHVAGDVGLLEAADAVLEAGRAGDGPRPRERLGSRAYGLNVSDRSRS